MDIDDKINIILATNNGAYTKAHLIEEVLANEPLEEQKAQYIFIVKNHAENLDTSTPDQQAYLMRLINYITKRHIGIVSEQHRKSTKEKIYELFYEECSQIEKYSGDRNEYLDRQLSSFNLDQETKRAFLRAGLKTVRDIIGCSRVDIYAIKDIGNRRLRKIYLHVFYPINAKFVGD